MANEIDDLMNQDPLTLTKDDLSKIVAYHRQRRADFELGVKPKKETGPKQTIDLNALFPGSRGPAIKRRI